MSYQLAVDITHAKIYNVFQILMLCIGSCRVKETFYLLQWISKWHFSTFLHLKNFDRIKYCKTGVFFYCGHPQKIPVICTVNLSRGL